MNVIVEILNSGAINLDKPFFKEQSASIRVRHGLRWYNIILRFRFRTLV